MPYAFVTYEVAHADVQDAVRALDAAGYIVSAEGIRSRYPTHTGIMVTGAPYERDGSGQPDHAGPILCEQTSKILTRVGIEHEMNGNGYGDAFQVRKLD